MLKIIDNFVNLGVDWRIILKLVSCVKRTECFELDLSRSEDSGVLYVR